MDNLTPIEKEHVERRLRDLQDYQVSPELLEVSSHSMGRGGFGTVSKAVVKAAWRNKASGSEVAVKVLNPAGQSGSEKVILQLVSEIAIWSGLHHPNVLEFLGFHLDISGRIDAWLLSPLLEGNLRMRLFSTDITSVQRVKWALGIVDGLAYLHFCFPRVHHGDLKPENILLTKDQTPVLCDFGLSKLEEGDATGLPTNEPYGTPAYCSPELFVDDPPRHTVMSDMWALGCMFLELLVGRQPYDGTVQYSPVLSKIIKGILPADTRLLPVPNPLIRLLDGCWDKIPARRPTAKHCRIILEALLTQPGDCLRRGEAEPEPFDDPDAVENSPTALPHAPAVFYGREEYVQDVVSRMIQLPQFAYALLGPGGFGKTSVAAALSRHQLIVEKFGSNLHWVSCVEAESAARLIELLFEAFDLPAPSDEDPLNQLESSLGEDQQTRLLFLDNLETPWNTKDRAEVEAILEVVTRVPSLSVLITMRNDTGKIPFNGAAWTVPPLLPLDVLSPLAARQTYVANHPDAAAPGEDEALSALLRELDYIPLAVRLVAQVGENTREMPTALLDRWRNGISASTTLEVDPHLRIERAIIITLHSSMMRSRTEALRLLSIICMLPGGMQVGLLDELAPEISPEDREIAKTQLLRTTLVSEESGILDVLPPIRLYILQNHPPSKVDRAAVYQAYYKLVDIPEDHLKPGDFFDKTIGRFKPEETNLHFILKEAVENDKSDDALRAALAFSQYLDYTRPSPELAALCVEVAEETTSSLLPNCLKQLGDILITLCSYSKAEAALQSAVDKYLTVSNTLGAAECHRCIAFIRFMQDRYDESKGIYEIARREFVKAGRTSEAAVCSREIGDILIQQRRYDEAREILDSALTDFVNVGETREAATCGRSIGTILFLQRAYSESLGALLQSRQQCERVKDVLGGAETCRLIGNVYRMQSRFEDAHTSLTQAMKEYGDAEDSLGVAACHQSFGDLARAQRRWPEAMEELKTAETALTGLEDTSAVAECRLSMGDILRLQGQYKEAKAIFKSALKDFESIGDPLGVAEHHRLVGEMLLTCRKYRKARTLLESALPTFRRIGDPLGVAQCQVALGRLILERNAVWYTRRSRTEIAIAALALSEAKKMFLEIGDVSSAASTQVILDTLGSRDGGSDMPSTPSRRALILGCLPIRKSRPSYDVHIHA